MNDTHAFIGCTNDIHRLLESCLLLIYSDKQSSFRQLLEKRFVAREMFKIMKDTEAVVQKCFIKRVFLEILQIHRKTPVPEPLF